MSAELNSSVRGEDGGIRCRAPFCIPDISPPFLSSEDRQSHANDLDTSFAKVPTKIPKQEKTEPSAVGKGFEPIDPASDDTDRFFPGKSAPPLVVIEHSGTFEIFYSRRSDSNKALGIVTRIAFAQSERLTPAQPT